MKPRVILAGGTGFVGTALVPALLSKNYDAVVLTRDAASARDPIQFGELRLTHWDGRTLGDWTKLIDGASAVVNLTGASINTRHTPENRRKILESRVNSVRVLGQAIACATQKPAVFVQASGVGFYGETGDRICDEACPAGHDFPADVCRQWEAEFKKIDAPGLRKVILRLGVVLGRDGGFLKVLGRLTQFFLGGQAGNGRQFISWIHIADLARMFVSGIEDEKLAGVFNATSPNPVTNAEFMRELRRVLHRPWSPPVPKFAVRVGATFMGTEPSLALTGQRATPKHFLETGFNFDFAELRAALSNIYPPL